MPSQGQLQKIWDLSDRVLYPEAIAFIRHLVNEEECLPLPATQVTGLRNIANTSKYSELERFIRHQRDRDWNEKKDIEIFYNQLDKLFTTMRNKRIKDEFRLVSEGLNNKEARLEVDELMALLTREFIQHLVAENGLLLAAREAARRSGRR